MHELAAVGTLVDAALLGVAGHQPCRVDVVRVRRSAVFSEDALIQAFMMLAQGTTLDGARLEIESVDQLVDCACARSRQVTADDLVGHIWACPACGHVVDVSGDHELELLGVTLTQFEAR